MAKAKAVKKKPAMKAAKATKAATKVAKPAKAVKPPPKLPAVAVKPKKPSAPSLPLPPPPPPPPPERDEMIAPRDIARLLRYGERFGPTKKIDIRMLQLQLPCSSSALAICDPATPKSWKVFDRPVAPGVFRVMLSVAKDGDKEQLAAVVVHVGRPPIAKWTVAHYKGQKKPKSPDQLPKLASTTGWIALLDAGDGSPGAIGVPATPTGTTPVEVPLTDGRRALALPCGEGEYVAYWAVDATDKPICLVVDFDVFTQKDWKAKPT